MSHKPDELLTLVAEYVDFAESALTKLAKEVLDPKAKVRNRGTVCVPAESAKDKKDHFPINDIDQARNALARVHQYTKVPDWYSGSLKGLQDAVSRKVHSKYPSIGKETSKKKASVDSLISKYGQGTNANYGGEGVTPSQMTAQQLAQKPQDLGQLFRTQQISPQQYRDAIAIINKQEGGSDQTPKWGPQSPYGTPDTITGHAPKTTAPAGNKKIMDLQTKLRDTYKLTGADGKPLKVDGILGPNTRFAIQSYKTEYNMPQATDAMAIYNIMNTAPEEHAGRYTNTPGQPNNEIERKNPF